VISNGGSMVTINAMIHCSYEMVGVVAVGAGGYSICSVFTSL